MRYHSALSFAGAAELARVYAAEYATAGHYEGDADRCRMCARTYYPSIVLRLKITTRKASSWIMARAGAAVRDAHREGFRVQGVEPSVTMAAHCRRKRSGCAARRFKHVAGKGGANRRVPLNTVFEHLVAHNAWLTHAHRLLAPRGLFVTLQPTAPFADFMGRVVRFGNVRAPLPALHQFFCRLGTQFCFRSTA